jgi:hypothetical protein
MNSLGGRPGSAFSEDTTGVQNDGIPVSVEEMDSARNKLAANVAQIDSQSCGLPLSIFTKVYILFFINTSSCYNYPQGYLCHPYLSLPYMDMLSDVNVRGYIIGATNVLFKQKNQLADVLVEVEELISVCYVALTFL